MKIAADLWSDPRPELLVETLERRQLDGAVLSPAPLFGQIDGTDFIRVRGIGVFSTLEDPEKEYPSHHRRSEDLLAGVYGVGVTIAYLVIVRRSEIAVYFGLRGAGECGRTGDTLLHNALGGLFPGVLLDDSSGETHRLGQRLRDGDFFAHQGMMTGIPTLKRPVEGACPECPWDFLLRALSSEEWGYFLLAKPVEMGQIVDTAHLASEGRRLYSFHSKEQMQKSPGVTAEVEGGPAHEALELLKRTQERLEAGKAEGMWEVEVHFFAPNEVTVRKSASLLRAAFAGEDSQPEPVRTFVCSSASRGGSGQPNTLLTSAELAVLTQLPQEEKSGYRVRELARFDVAVSDDSVEDAVAVGQVLDSEKDTGNAYAVNRADLAKHTLITGVTGSGKTNTCFHLLDQVWGRSKGIPFLVIEPAKTEYRDLIKAKDEQERLIFPGLRVFTLGSEQVAPFRLNPFEFEILDQEHATHVQTHIDHLKSVFAASFILYAPMPYVLERCLHEVYQDRGWDLASGINHRVGRGGDRLPAEAFPNLTDLYNKVGEVVSVLGYEERIRMDVTAALETRLNSLRIGGKGLMLDTRQSVPLRELLVRPTILELESIGDDEEKVFVIGLLLTRLYEHRVAQAKQWRTHGRRPPTLQHLTVIEEAHRLLRHVPPEAHPEVTNVRGKAVESFANMLAEIRAYGEGVIVADQIPTKLASDVIKNTNLKVLHRVVAEDDRTLVGGTMNLDEAQKRFVTTLKTGQAVVFAEGDDRSLLVAVARHRATEGKGQIADQDVALSMRGFCTGEVYNPYPACPERCKAMNASEGRCPHHLRDQARSIADDPSVQRALGLWVLSTVEDQAQFTASYPLLRDAMRRVMFSPPRVERDLLLCGIIQGLDVFFERKMRRYRWLLNVADSLKGWVLTGASEIVYEYEDDSPERNEQILDQYRDTLGRLSSGYQQQCARDFGPHPGCDFCTRRCLYRSEVEHVVGDRLLQDRLLRALRSSWGGEHEEARDSAMWEQVCRVCLDAAHRVIASDDASALRRIALCYAAHMGSVLGFSPVAQKTLAGGVWTALNAN